MGLTPLPERRFPDVVKDGGGELALANRVRHSKRKASPTGAAAVWAEVKIEVII